MTNKTPSDLLATKEQFQQWVASHAPETTIGIAEECDQCPLASYLAQQGFYKTEVEESFITLYPSAEKIPLPEWARQFVTIVDWRTPRVEDKRSVTAAEAIAALEGREYNALPSDQLEEMYPTHH